MAYKTRIESKELKILRILNTRMNLQADEKRYYLNLEKGFEGEVEFDLLTEKLSVGCLILNELLLEWNGKDFQIDTFIILQETCFIFEIKNFEGEFIFQPHCLKSLSAGKEFQNPLDQLNRCKLLLRPLLQSHGFNIPIDGYVVFTNPQFTLYQAPHDEPIILPTKLKSFMKKFDTQSSKLSSWHRKLADKLISLHKTESKFSNVPEYDYIQQRKGMTCSPCNSFNVYLSNGKLVCNDCGYEEGIDSAVLRCVEEIKLLFPDMKITTNVVQEWCGVVSIKTIRRVLKQNYYVVGKKEYSFLDLK